MFSPEITENPDHVYYYCSQTNTMAVLKKCSDTLTNEKRNHLIHPENAKYHANKLKVVLIIDAENQKEEKETCQLPYRENKTFYFHTMHKGNILTGTVFNSYTMQSGIPYFKTPKRMLHDYLFATKKLLGVLDHEHGSVDFQTFDSFGKNITRSFDINTHEELYSLAGLVEPLIVDAEKVWKRMTRIFN